jgi:hypothetical protein
MRISRLTYTNVVATLALFIALGGSSYAAVTLTGANVRNGTVTGTDLKNESLKGGDVDNGSLTGTELKGGSVSASDLDDGSLTGADVKPGQLAAGPQGPPGPAGTTQVLTRRIADVALNSGDAKDVTASCLAGEVAVGGGGAHDGTVSDIVGVVYSYPLEADGSPPEDGERATAWRVGADNPFFTGIDRTLTAYVLCAKA